jgi:hypothetical protein
MESIGCRRYGLIVATPSSGDGQFRRVNANTGIALGEIVLVAVRIRIKQKKNRRIRTRNAISYFRVLV